MPTTTTFPLEIQNKVFDFFTGENSPAWKRPIYTEALADLMKKTSVFGLRHHSSTDLAEADLTDWLNKQSLLLTHEVDALKTAAGLTPPAPKVGTIRLVLDVEVEGVSADFGKWGPSTDDRIVDDLTAAVRKIVLPAKSTFGGDAKPRPIKSATWRSYAAGIDLATKAPDVRNGYSF